MEYEIKSTAPKPFVFVLMPFDEKFNDIYTFGIKGAAEDAGAYAERIDEQIFTEGILERIFNQINKADVIVADMTGRNQNVFYEVGYAHALGKIVLLLTQNADDIPFDLKHRQHIVYAGKIETLRSKLSERLVWAISESGRKGKQNLLERLLVSRSNVEIPEAISPNNFPIIEKFPLSMVSSSQNYKAILNFSIRNRSSETINISFIYLFAHSEFFASADVEHDLDLRMIRGYSFIEANTFDSPDGLSKQFRIVHKIPPLPPEAVHQLIVEISPFIKGITDELFMLRIHTSNSFHDFPFRIRADIKK